MPSPTPLAIATGSVNRLVKERLMYKKELSAQEHKIKVTQELFDRVGNTENENAEFELNQHKEALKQTQNVFPGLDKKITESIEKLKAELSSAEAVGGQEDEVAKAKEALENGEKVVQSS